MADIGYIALFLALVTSVYSAIAFIFGTRRNHPGLSESAKNSLLATFGLVSIATIILVYALVTHNFQIEYVASYTSRDLPLSYLLSALWAGNDGSLLFWAWLLSLCATIVILQKRDVGKELVPYAASITMITQAFFLLLLVSVSNPFQTLSFTPADGRGLNPLLENPGMILHPPLLLAGYVGFTIPFAFAIASLLTRRFGDEWIIAIRRWTLLPWLLLGLGNLVGAWWAYVELGWGGYWAWDPVESAGLMPWLTATAFLHSIMMQRRRGMLKVWNMVLMILTFALSIFGTFLTRSGVLSSVHTFSDSILGPFFLTFIGITLFGSLILLYQRSEELQGESEMESLVSRESTFLLNNLLLVGAAFAIFVGTIFPLISEAVRHVKITVGAPFFNQVNVPIFLAIVLLAGICTLIGWRQASVKNLVRNFLWPLVVAIVLAIVLFITGIREWSAVITFPVCAFVLSTIFYEWFRGTRARHRMRDENYLKAFWNLIGANRPRYGGYIVHISIVLIAIGIAGSSLYEVSTEATIKPGESMTIKNYTLTYESKDSFDTESKRVDTASLLVYNGGKLLGRLIPAKYFHRSYEQAVTEVAIRTTLREDLYVILVGWDENDNTAFKVLVNPMVDWIWIGGLVFTIGGLIAFWPERRGLKAPTPARTKADKEE
ncbi:MAG: heme lyase CcmF/NrfE family subunit [Chloroflexi bacterium]|nr:heme lyase CcmF/NrfE family subunit [Chloroflexota bacterium]